MSEYINNTLEQRKALLKHMILELHKGVAPQLVKARIKELLQSIPYNQVVEVEQELIAEGLPETEVMKLCDLHSAVLDGSIDTTAAKVVPAGHPVDTFKKENVELEKVISVIFELLDSIKEVSLDGYADFCKALHGRFNEVMDVNKHYLRKEYLLFPFLEKHGITGPPKVMWGKHDEIREKLKAAHEIIAHSSEITKDELEGVVDIVIKPALYGIGDMIMKEEQILLPMSLDTLSEQEWYEVYQQTMEFGFCLYDPTEEWKPDIIEIGEVTFNSKNSLQLSTGSFAINEIEALFKTLPIDLTFVDKQDKVKFFSLGPDRIFTRNRAIIGRDVRMCHPPGSVHIVDQILEDFKSGKETSAAFWIQMRGKFIYIEYFAMKDKNGEYLGTVEFTQDLTHLRALEGEQRILQYKK